MAFGAFEDDVMEVVESLLRFGCTQDFDEIVTSSLS